MLVSRIINCYSYSNKFLFKAFNKRSLPNSFIQSALNALTTDSSDEKKINGHILTLACNSADEVELLGYELSSFFSCGDVILLSGDLGAGKTTFARGVVRSKCNDAYMVVNSPSYLLDNKYQYNREQCVHHMDLYRLPEGCDLSILGFPSIFDTALCLIEWPQRISNSMLPSSYLGVEINISSHDSRQVKLKPVGKKWAHKMQDIISSIGAQS